MTALVLPHVLANGIAADGANLEANFTAIETHVNTEMINRDGSVAMTGALTLVAPSSASHAARKQDVDGAVPVGSVIMYGGTTEPTNYLFCRGQAVSRATYATLFTAIGTAYGTGDGSTTFNLPNFQATVPVGHNTGTNSPSGLTSTFTSGVGQRAGSKDATVVTHTHTGPSHSHTFSGTTGGQSATHYHTGLSGNTLLSSVDSGSGVYTYVNGGGIGPLYLSGTDYASGDHTHTYSGTTADAGTGATGSTGSSGTDANLQPSLTINFVIKAA
jgi:microcystin-dependent protein